MDIWHNKDEIPEFGRDLLLKIKSSDGTIYHIVSDSSNWDIFNPIKWCYVDDLIAQSVELEKYKQDLDIANKTLSDNGLLCPRCSCISKGVCSRCQEEICYENQYEQDREPTREMLMDGCIIDSNGNPY